MILLLSALALGQEEGETLTEGVAPVAMPSAAPPPVVVGDAWPATVGAGALALGVEERFVGLCWEAAEELYKRDYRAARDAFAQAEKSYPNRGVGHVGLVMILQAKMMENFDFKGEAAYLRHSENGVEELELALKEPGNQAWEHFLMGALVGIDAIHVMRKGDYLPAISRGLSAIDHIDQVRVLAPDFKDILLFDGLWDYWKSTVSLSTKLIPDEDNRVRGMKRMKLAEQEATFMGPGASLSLAFTYIEERDYTSALSHTGRNYKAYPHNVINNLVHGRNYLYLRKYKSSLKVLEQVLVDDPKNERVHYYLATNYLRLRELELAEQHIDTYLGFEEIDDYHRAQALSRKGDILYKDKSYAEAEVYYKMAVKTDGYKPAKKRVEKLKEMKKAGKY